MSRNSKKDAEIRQSRQIQILDAALSIYVRMGFHGTDMDQVADEAGLAKGLLYYYYKSKHQLFRAMFDWATGQTLAVYQSFLADVQDASAIEKLSELTWRIFGSALIDARYIQFSMRLPFDAHAVFENGEWEEGKNRSRLFMQMLAQIIRQGIDEGDIPQTDPDLAANGFWAVFVANLFHFTKLIQNGPDLSPIGSGYREVVHFCFQGLGIDSHKWLDATRQRAMRKDDA